MQNTNVQAARQKNKIQYIEFIFILIERKSKTKLQTKNENETNGL